MKLPYAVVTDSSLTSYDFGRGHPLAPIRVQLAWALAQHLGLLDGEDIRLLDQVPTAPDDLLLAIHEREYVEAVRAASESGHAPDAQWGMGTADVPVFLGMHEASQHICGATLAAVQEVYNGRAAHGVNIAGGLHHAMPDRAAGFCVYNDVAVGIRWLLDQGVERIAYLDVDAHHGDGVQAAFFHDPRVLTVSIHESGRTLFPGTGFAHEVGGRGAEGSVVNIALPAGVSDNQWLRAYHAVVPDVIEAFGPQFLISQHGCDSHAEDPLTHLMLSVDGQRTVASSIHRMAHRLAHGNWVAVGGGGYEWVDVVPRTWAHLIGEVVHRPVAPRTPIPEEYRALVEEIFGRPGPELMTEGFDPWAKPFVRSYTPESPLDRAIMASREAVFPYWGLVADPYGAM